MALNFPDNPNVGDEHTQEGTTWIWTTALAWAIKAVAAVEGAKTWILFDGGGGITIHGSNNITSITDNGVGLWTLNITVALVVGYSAAVGYRANDTASVIIFGERSSRVGGTAWRCRAFNYAGTANQDWDTLSVIFDDSQGAT